jgi:hypothetical protein
MHTFRFACVFRAFFAFDVSLFQKLACLHLLMHKMNQENRFDIMLTQLVVMVFSFLVWNRYLRIVHLSYVREVIFFGNNVF